MGAKCRVFTTGKWQWPPWAMKYSGAWRALDQMRWCLCGPHAEIDVSGLLLSLDQLITSQAETSECSDSPDLRKKSVGLNVGHQPAFEMSCSILPVYAAGEGPCVLSFSW